MISESVADNDKTQRDFPNVRDNETETRMHTTIYTVKSLRSLSQGHRARNKNQSFSKFLLTKSLEEALEVLTSIQLVLLEQNRHF
jgi:hypothetical protein